MKFSIITCTYNSAEYLQKNIDSVKSQTLHDFEHIFIDGYSSDATLDIITAYQRQFPERVKVFQFEPRGISDAMNKGIEAAQGEYINHLHSDDFFDHENVLRDVAQCIERHHHPAWVYGKARFIEAEKGLTRIIPHRSIYHRVRFWLLLLTDYIPHQAVFLQKKVFEKYGVFDTAYSVHMDYELWVRLAKEKVPAVFLDEVICNYTLRKDANSVAYRLHNNDHERIYRRYCRFRFVARFLMFFVTLNRRRSLF